MRRHTGKGRRKWPRGIRIMEPDRFEGFPYARGERRRERTALECWREEGYDAAGDMPVCGQAAQARRLKRVEGERTMPNQGMKAWTGPVPEDHTLLGHIDSRC